MVQDLIQYVVYQKPSDHPEEFVVRKWGILKGKTTPLEIVAKGDDLDEVKKAIPPGFHCLPRNPADDPAILEVWI